MGTRRDLERRALREAAGWRRRRDLSCLLLVALVAACTGSSTRDDGGADGEGDEATAPSIVFIMTDDQRWDTVAQLPAIASWDRWATFEGSFVHEPVCCPSRATALTGRYSHHTTVELIGDIEGFDASDTVATRLQSAGYATGFFGKYLAGYADDAAPPPGWTTFARFTDPPAYAGHQLAVDGVPVDGAGYSTDDLAERAVAFVRETPPDQPLLLAYWPFAPHGAAFGFPEAAERHRGSCSDEGLPAIPMDADGGTDEPAWVQQQVAASSPFVAGARATRWIVGCEALQAVDEAFSALLAAIEETGRSESTYVVFTSDNGYSFGERGLDGKGHLYDESIRVPLLIAGPGVEPGPVDLLASNVDLVPTFLEWAGVPAVDVDGTSLAGALRGERTTGREAILLRGCGLEADEVQCLHVPGAPSPGDVWGLRTVDRKLVVYPDGSAQLFDLVTDPGELDDLADDPAHAVELRALRSQLSALMADAGAG